MREIIQVEAVCGRCDQRVLNDLYRTTLSRPLYDLAPPLTPSPVSKLPLSSYVSPVELTEGILRKGMGEEPNHVTKKSLVLF